MEEDELMDLLNDDLREKIVLYINGRNLQNLTFYDEFNIEFVSQLAFRMQ